MLVRVVFNGCFWFGICLVGQLFAFLPVRGLFEGKWLYSSIGLAIAGGFLLLFQRWLVRDGDDTSDYGNDKDGTAGQAMSMIDAVERHHD